MSRVFFIEQSRADKDVSTAAEFGEVIYLFSPSRRRASVFEPDLFAKQVIEALRSHAFDPAVDYFGLFGNVIAVSVSTSALTAEYGEFTALMFQSSECRYCARRITHHLWKGTVDASISQANTRRAC